ncbi:MAG: peptide ABC transporter substrate-binding protein [Neisseriaceae bacterium]|nr:MAG: peptide ABC transporter substrate-binding protein [Neisseriaceae bacterium]
MKHKLIISSILSIALLNSCTDNSEHSTHKQTTHPQDELRVDIGSEPPSLDPQLLADTSSARVTNDLFAGLVDFDQKNQLIPGLADKWTISSDGKTYTFYLRQGIKFSDGTPITANDVVFSWQRLANPAFGAPYAQLLANVLNYQAIAKNKKSIDNLGIRAINSTTLEVNLTQATPDFLKYLTLPAFAALSAHAVSKYNTEWTKPQNMVSSGAYQLVEHVVNGKIIVKKNPYYYAAAEVAIPQVSFLPYSERNSALNAYKSGDLDMTFSLPTNDTQRLISEYPQEVKRTNYEALVYYDFNMQLPMFKDIRLRQALTMAIDRPTLVTKIITDENRLPLYSTVTPTIANAAYADIHYQWESWPRDKQLETAKQLYAAAGYSPTKPLKITILYNNDEGNKKRTLALASMWHDVLGVQVEVRNQEWKTFLTSRQKGDFEIARDGSNAEYNSVSAYTNLYLCNSRLNNSHYCNPDYDKLIAAADKASDVKIKTRYYHQALELVLADYPIIPLYQPSYSRLVKPYVKNYVVKDNHLDQVQSKWLSLK